MRCLGFEKVFKKIVEKMKILVKLMCIFISTSLRLVGERNEVVRLARFISKCKR
jgi:hypothetical protein